MSCHNNVMKVNSTYPILIFQFTFYSSNLAKYQIHFSCVALIQYFWKDKKAARMFVKPEGKKLPSLGLYFLFSQLVHWHW